MLLLLASLATSGSGTLHQAHALQNWTIDIRRALHQRPELLYELQETAAYVRSVLDGLGVVYNHSIAGHGIVASVGSGLPCVALRADMDALPIQEEIACEFKSRKEGNMHACGHDAHTAMLLAAVRMLKERESELHGTVKFIFQPAEEGGAGGLRMLEEGVLNAEPRIQRIYALHVWPGMPSGTVASRSGTLMAAAGFFHARFVGRGGHAAMPHTTTDPIMCAANALATLQTVVARNTAPVEAAVISTTFLRGGSAYNIIPDDVEMGGTMRSLSREGYRLLEEQVACISWSRSHACFCRV